MTHTPWGPSDYSKQYATGLMFYGTPGHGGLHVSPKRLEQMPLGWRQTSYAPPGWFEEDCDWVLPVLWFAEDFSPNMVAEAVGSATRWHADKLSDLTDEKWQMIFRHALKG